MGWGTPVCCSLAAGFTVIGVPKTKSGSCSARGMFRSLSTSPHDHHKTVQYMYYIAPYMPTPNCCAINMTQQWLRKHAHWRGGPTTAGSYNPPYHQTARRAHGTMMPPSYMTSNSIPNM